MRHQHLGAARESHVALTAAKTLAGQMDSHARRGTRTLHVDRRSGEAKSKGDVRRGEFALIPELEGVREGVFQKPGGPAEAVEEVSIPPHTSIHPNPAREAIRIVAAAFQRRPRQLKE